MLKYKASDDGAMMDGRIVVFLRPNYRGAQPEPEVTPPKPAAEPEPPEVPSPIKNLRWGTSTSAHGDEVEMLADVPEDSKVLFTVERRIGEGAWQSMGSVNAQVASGTARATTHVEHACGLDAVHYRFRARLL